MLCSWLQAIVCPGNLGVHIGWLALSQGRDQLAVCTLPERAELSRLESPAELTKALP